MTLMPGEARLRRLCVAHHRFFDNPKEVEALRFLLRPSSCYGNELNMIKAAILCMSTSHANYQHLDTRCKNMAIELARHNRIVDITMATVFQWFGTPVGFCDISHLIENIRHTPHSPDEEEEPTEAHRSPATVRRVDEEVRTYQSSIIPSQS